MRGWCGLALVLAACGSGSSFELDAGTSDGGSSGDASSDGSAADARVGDGGSPDARPADAAMSIDLDQDGLDDAMETGWARAYLPFISLSPNEAADCKVGGIAARITPFPGKPRCVRIIYDYLYNKDCGSIGGIGGHPGDDEVFAVTANLDQAPPAGILAMRAISHQGTLCERTSNCGSLAGLTACETLAKAGTPWPALWPSKDKHGSYVNRSTSCAAFATCIDACEDNPTPTEPAIVNVGEPAHPLVHNLTTQGFITAANGWTNAQLLDYDPWGNTNFGNAGNVTGDLTDTAFDTPPCP